ncbi:MAG: aspartate carbamoyltransferase [Alphaproteobacteria bacterium]
MSASDAGRRIRHVTSINDLSNSEIEDVFSLAAHYLKTLGDSSYRIGRSTNAAAGRILACLFLEPSTRTRLSFESAMQRLGGSTISITDPNASSAAKGESLADAIRMLSGYADAIVLRHPRDGAAKCAAEFASVPVVNGGDGAHEHPTQTLADLFTLLRERGAISGLTVAIAGDLKGGRTVHSLCYALARFGANINLMPAPGLDLPAHVLNRLHDEFACTPIANSNAAVDALYVTRFQKERSSDEARNYPKIDPDFLSNPRFANASVLHPLPRVDELDPALDGDPRAAYMRQASYGVPVRMALLTRLLGLDGKSLAPQQGPAAKQISNKTCPNAHCITHDFTERKFAVPRFTILQSGKRRLRCFYCETDLD